MSDALYPPRPSTSEKVTAWCIAIADLMSGKAPRAIAKRLLEERRFSEFLESQNEMLKASMAAQFPDEYCFSRIVTARPDEFYAQVVYEKGGVKRELGQTVWGSTLKSSDERHEWLGQIAGHIRYDLERAA
jgi:hypothetical protein